PSTLHCALPISAAPSPSASRRRRSTSVLAWPGRSSEACRTALPPSTSTASVTLSPKSTPTRASVTSAMIASRPRALGAIPRTVAARGPPSVNPGRRPATAFAGRGRLSCARGTSTAPASGDRGDRGCMSWHPAYRGQVLALDYRFASEFLRHHFIDAMTAHLDAVLALPAHAAPEVRSRGAELRAGLVALHDEPVPVQDDDVPDLYFALQRVLEARHGDAVGLIRLGLSRNDLDMTVYKMHGRELLLEVGLKLAEVRRLLLERAAAHLDTVLIAQTHHRPGQPTTVAHYLSAGEDMLQPDFARVLP